MVDDSRMDAARPKTDAKNLEKPIYGSECLEPCSCFIPAYSGPQLGRIFQSKVAGSFLKSQQSWI
jgi:hypothetical protein